MTKNKRRRNQQTKNHGGRYLTFHVYLWESAAWLALKPNARSAFIFMLQRFNGFNNGDISCSVREVAENIRVSKNTAKRAIDELLDKGFIAVTKEAGFSQKNRTAREYRFTHLDVVKGNGNEVAPTHDYRNWKPVRLVK